MSQHHFIIMFDTETRMWSWEWDTEDTQFPNGTIKLFDGEEVRWTDLSDLNIDRNLALGKVDVAASKTIIAALELLNNLQASELEIKLLDAEGEPVND